MAKSKATKTEWWRGAVIYQIYPRSFMDSNNDGVGDLNGITEKLDYVASLGVDAIWLSPFFTSPMKDYGYDVSDYCGVDPLFGSLADFKTMLDKAHRLGLKVIIDQVLSHSSDQHAWFKESRQSRSNPKADWYVWADPKKDGSPPNNWQSVFGEGGWTYEVRRGQYYWHNFLISQPDLNLYNPAVKKALLDACRFWLDMGVDGFRLDAIIHFFHDLKLRDNPVNPHPTPLSAQIDFATPYSMQRHVRDNLIPPAITFARDIRKLLDEYPDRMAVAEVGGESSVLTANQFTDGPKNLQTAYNFSLISGTVLSAKRIRDAVEEFEDAPGDGWPSWAFSNHDVMRVGSRWHPDKDGYHHDARLTKMLVALLCCLKGTPFIYQGEELGLPEAAIPFEQLQDPWGKYLYPLSQGRDGCRTPMPWQGSAAYGGFSTAVPWLPVPDAHLPLAADRQENVPAEPGGESMLLFTRRFLAWRRREAVLRSGDIRFVDPAGLTPSAANSDALLAFRRSFGGLTLFCAFNLSEAAHSFTAPAGLSAAAFDGHRQTGVVNDDNLVLPPYGFYIGVAPGA